MTVTTRTRSVGHNEPAADFITWLLQRWMDLSDAEKESASIEIRASGDFFMMGLRWTENH